jgi:hypothetical protein
MNDNEINDKRTQKEFVGISFSKYKKGSVKTQLIKSLINGKLEDSCYWSAELVCAGHYEDVWECIILCVSKHIHIGNPKLPIYVNMRMDNFREIVSNGYLTNELAMRNNNKVRKLFAELICILCFSRKKHSYDAIKIGKNDFNMTELGYKLQADNINYGQPTCMKEDPKELFIAVNELAYNISANTLNTHNSCYWVEWILEFEAACKKKKEKCCCERRAFIPVDGKLQKDIVWIIWDVLLYESTKRNKMIGKIIQSLLKLFCIRYTPGVKKRRKSIIYFVIALLTESCNTKIQIIENKTLVENAVKRIDNVYKQIKKNEVKPETDYLYHGIKKTNLEKTIEKINVINNFKYIPRS